MGARDDGRLTSVEREAINGVLGALERLIAVEQLRDDPDGGRAATIARWRDVADEMRRPTDETP